MAKRGTGTSGYGGYLIPFLFLFVIAKPGIVPVDGKVYYSDTDRICRQILQSSRRGLNTPTLEKLARACRIRRLLENPLLSRLSGFQSLDYLLVSPINDPSTDTTLNVTFQSEPAIVLSPPDGSDPSSLDDLLVLFWDNGEYSTQSVLTGWARSLDGGVTWEDMGIFPEPPDYGILDAIPLMSIHELDGTVDVVMPVFHSPTFSYQVMHATTTDRGVTWNYEYLFNPAGAPYRDLAFAVDHSPFSSCSAVVMW